MSLAKNNPLTVALPRYSRAEEIANSLTHGVGILLSIAGLAILTSFASVFGTAWHIVSVSIYGATQITLYTASTLYHSITSPRAKAVLRIFDHSAIFLLIAGTYTPFALVNLRGPWGWSLFGVVWGLAAIGIAIQGVLIRQKGFLTALPYIGMGWLALIAIRPLWPRLPVAGWLWLIAGGLAYTAGAAFFAAERVRYGHFVWHVFVLIGTTCHFFAVLWYSV